MRKEDIAYLGLLVMGLVASVWIGLAGIDFGPHWDEPNTINEVIKAVQTGVLLPRWYNYPDFTFDLSLTALVPSVARAVLHVGLDAKRVSEELLVYANSDAYHFRVRIFCLMFTEIGSLGVVGAMLALGFRMRDAAICGLFLLSSWQVSYHARWIAPDALLCASAAIFIPLSIAACRFTRALSWAKVAAAGLGLAISCKYPGGVLLLAFLPCFYMRLVNQDGWPVVNALWACTIVVAVTVVAFLALTPGAYVEPFRFLRDINDERLHYTVSGHGAHTIEAVWPRFIAVTRFLLLSCFSPFALVAWILALCVPLGAVRLWRRDRISFAVVILPAVLSILYFSSVKVVFVRNYLFIFPYLAVLAATGLFAAVDRLPSRALRFVGTAVPVLFVAMNFSYGATAAASIRNRDTVDFGAALETYLAEHAGERIYVAPSALKLASLPAFDLANAVPSLQASDHVIYDADQFDWDHQYINMSAHNLCNRPGVYRTVAGPRETDWDYYPDWISGHRLLMVKTKDYEQLSLY